MSTDLKKKLGTPIILIGLVLLVVEPLIPVSEGTGLFVVVLGAMLAMAGGLLVVLARQRAGQCSEEDVESKQGA